MKNVLLKEVLMVLAKSLQSGNEEYVDVLTLRLNSEIKKSVTDHSTLLSQINAAICELKRLGLVEADADDKSLITKCMITPKGLQFIKPYA